MLSLSSYLSFVPYTFIINVPAYFPDIFRRKWRVYGESEFFSLSSKITVNVDIDNEKYK